MSANKRTFEVDRFLTRELLLRNPDNTVPTANQAVLTDGRGGVYYNSINGSTATTGFNRLFLVDSGATLNADLSFNLLQFKEGAGVVISKLNTNTVLFQTVPIVPSSFYKVSTPTGFVYADNLSSVLNIRPSYGVNIDISDNMLLMSGNPAFSNFDVSTTGAIRKVKATSQISTLKIAPGFGIDLEVTDTNTLRIASNFSTYALNQLSLPDGNTYKFTQKFNPLTFNQIGNIEIYASTPNTVVFETHGYSQISTPAGTILASTTKESLNLIPGYGLNYNIISSALQVETSLPSSFSYISTNRGTVSTPYSTNTLTLVQGYGIDYAVKDQNLTIKLASTLQFGNFIRAAGNTISANSALTFNLNKGNEGIQYSTSSDNQLYLRTTDFARIDISGGASLFSYNNITGVTNNFFRLAGGKGVRITGDNNTNNITIFPPDNITPGQGGPAYAFSYVKLFSTMQYIGQNTAGFQSVTFNSFPVSEATLSFAGVAPISVLPLTDITKNMYYIGLDQSTLLGPLQENVSSMWSTLDQHYTQLVTPELLQSTLSTTSIHCPQIDADIFSLKGSVILSSQPSIPSLLTVNRIQSQTSILATATISTVNISTVNRTPTTAPLMGFDYTNSRVGVNVGSRLPQATMEVNGILLAQTFATYSDSSLKNFTSEFEISHTDLEILKPWKFTWKSDNSEDIGFAAEDVEKVAPYAVKMGPNGLRMVDYGRLSVVSLAALRQTNLRLDAVESTLNGIRV